jgi:hypothetical protein
MKYLRLALISSAVALCALRAQDDQEQQKKAPTEIPDFTNLDEYIYVPKNKLKVGFRYTSGVKAHFAGQGTIADPDQVNAAQDAAPNVQRVYHDGTVGVDQRTTVVDNGDGSSSQVPVNGADGKTNNYFYDSQSQYTGDGFLQFHLYSATSQDYEFDKTSKGNAGLEVYVAHDMKVLSKRLEWKIFGGFSVNDIQASATRNVTATVYTQTDTYDTYGQTPSTNGASTTTSVNIVNGNGNLVLNSAGVAETSIVTNTVLISDVPLASSTVPVTDDVSVTNLYKLHGAYATIRVGPQLVYNINDHMHLEFSAGPALIYAGSTYQVNGILIPPTGVEEVSTVTSTTNHLMPGYYADLTLEYDLTERAGFYLGAFDQGAGSYVQTASTPVSSTGSVSSTYGTTGATGSVSSGTGDFTAKVDFGNLVGVRAGMALKF